MADEPTAIRPDGNTGSRAWHKPVMVDRIGRAATTACGTYWANPDRDPTERVPLSQTAPEDRCRTCWPTTKDVTP